jgi:ABC-type antimicrobial peptide transport system permease subunit
LHLDSREFVDDQGELWNPGLTFIVVPRAGQRATLDAWLETQVADEQHIVLTYGLQQGWIREAMNTGLFAISLMESIIALVAALALAGLNYLFVTQRQAEFGVLNALGLSRRQLVWRVARETLFVTGAAWLVGLLGCAVVLATLHYEQYAPLGLRLDFFNLTPWLYTLPIPVAVLAASAGTIAWLLSKLDPVALIERRV